MRLARLLPLLLAGCITAPRPIDRTAAVDRIIAAHPQQTIAVAMYDFRDGSTLLRNERETFHAASTMKVPVMFGIFQAVTRGSLRLDQPVAVRNEFTSILDRSSYSLEPGDDSDPALYEKVGSELPLEELVRRMIVRSSNLATNVVIELIGAPRIMELLREIGANDVQILRGVEDEKAWEAGLNNTTTAWDLMVIFKALAERNVVSAESSDAMLEILLAQEFNDGIPGGLPKEARVAHKTGSITRIAHDAGLVMLPGGERYVLVVLTRGFDDQAEAERVIASISEAVYRSRR
jgi:beta-lactamase class A